MTYDILLFLILCWFVKQIIPFMVEPWWKSRKPKNGLS